jgi:hypothetical protein
MPRTITTASEWWECSNTDVTFELIRVVITKDTAKSYEELLRWLTCTCYI